MHTGYGCSLSVDGQVIADVKEFTQIEIRNDSTGRSPDMPISLIQPIGDFLNGVYVLEVMTADGEWHDVKCSRDIDELRQLKSQLRYNGRSGWKLLDRSEWPP